MKTGWPRLVIAVPIRFSSVLVSVLIRVLSVFDPWLKILLFRGSVF